MPVPEQLWNVLQGLDCLSQTLNELIVRRHIRLNDRSNDIEDMDDAVFLQVLRFISQLGYTLMYT